MHTLRFIASLHGVQIIEIATNGGILLGTADYCVWWITPPLPDRCGYLHVAGQRYELD